MNRKPRSFWRATTVAVSAVLLGAVLLTVPTATHAQLQGRGQGDGPAAHGSGPAVYVVDGRVVAIRRDPVPPGAYGGHGVDYAPDMTAWILSS